MKNPYRSAAQFARHAEARKAKEDRRRLIGFLLRHEAQLEKLLSDIRAEFAEIDEHGHLRSEARIYGMVEPTED